MKKIIFVAAAVAAGVVASLIAYCTSEKDSEKVFLQANYEALMYGEDDGVFMRGPRSTQCGDAIISWNGLKTNCTEFIIECSGERGQDCTRRGCPIHG